MFFSNIFFKYILVYILTKILGIWEKKSIFNNNKINLNFLSNISLLKINIYLI